MKDICILGSTGSIGTQALEVVREAPGRFNIRALSCNRSIDKLEEQIAEFSPDAVCVGTEEDAAALSHRYRGLTVLWGKEGLKELCRESYDIVLNSLLGIAGLVPTVEAVKAGNDIAFANKETLVAGGSIVMPLVREKGVRMLPVDSEHSAIFQALQGQAGNKLKRIILTASGGPFRGYTREMLKYVTVEQTLRHPRWSMGNKITVDSATLMNKGFEIIEAKWLFDVEPEMIETVIHPESIIHSAVEFCDTGIIAQLGLPDMKVPIAYAFTYPERMDTGLESLDLVKAGRLTFEKPDREVFKCLRLAEDALKAGGTYPAALNGANEELVRQFLAGKIRYVDIGDRAEKVLDAHKSISNPSLEEILEEDRRAGELVKNI